MQPDESGLGKPVAYRDQYDASLLFPISRLPKRVDLGLHGTAPFFGADLWTAFELSWLTPVSYTHLTLPTKRIV